MDNYEVYEKYEDILLRPKQTSRKDKRNISCYSSKHVRIQQSKVFSKK